MQDGLFLINTDRLTPQRSVLGSILFNLLNDIYFVNSRPTAELYNYDYNNTICASSVNVAAVKIFLCTEATRNISWFKNNLMEANPNKFEFMENQRQNLFLLLLSNVKLNLNCWV